MTTAARQQRLAVPRSLGGLPAVVAALGAFVVLRGWLAGTVDGAAALAFTTVFLSVVLQALPLLVFGVLLQAGIDTFLPRLAAARFLAKAQRNDIATAALTTPAISPVVLAATAIAFPGHPGMVAARMLAGVSAAVLAALLSRRLGRPLPPWHPAGGDTPAFLDRCRRDCVQGGGALVGGAAVVALLAAVLPVRWLDTLAAYPVVAIVAAALFAVLISRRAEIDPFLMAALGQFSLTSRLVFLVVGATVNLRRFAAQSEDAGPAFAVRYHGAALATVTVAAALVGLVLV